MNIVQNFIISFFSATDKETNDEAKKTSSEDEVVRKRRRKPPGQWWLCSPQSAAETVEAPSSPPSSPPPKEQSKKAPAATTPTSKQTKKKEEAAKKRPPSSQNAVAAKEKKTKQDKKRDVDLVDKRMRSEEEPEEEPDPVQSSPAGLAGQEHSPHSGKQGCKVVATLYYCMEMSSLCVTSQIPPGFSHRRAAFYFQYWRSISSCLSTGGLCFHPGDRNHSFSSLS